MCVTVQVVGKLLNVNEFIMLLAMP